MRLYYRNSIGRILLTLALVATSAIAAITSSPQVASAANSDEVLDILSLTDSYGAGIGVSPKSETYYPGTGLTCTKGSTSQVLRVQESLEDKGWKVSVNDHASCMSYITDDLKAFVNSNDGTAAVKKADVIFVRIGGNDIGFSPKLKCAVLTDLACTSDWLPFTGKSQSQTRDDIAELLRLISAKSTTRTHVFVDNYPHLFGNGNSNTNSDDYGWDALNPGCILINRHLLSDGELENIRYKTDILNNIIASVTHEANNLGNATFTLMDSRPYYEGHEICGAGVDWINAVTAHPHWFHPAETAYEAESVLLEVMIGSRFNKRDFDGANSVEIPWGPYIGDIVKVNDGTRTSWLVMPTGRRHIPTGSDFKCFESQGSKLHYLNSGVMNSIPSAGGDITCSGTPTVPTGDHVYGNLPLACGIEIPFASTYDTYGSFSHGYAIDMPTPAGTTVVAPIGGKVTVKSDPNGYGNYIDLAGDDGRIHRFAHMQNNGLARNGARVEKSQPIGRVGSTGASTGPHLHYEQRVNGAGIAIQMDGPPLSWGARYTTGGDRTTTHKLVSGNCSPSGSQHASRMRVGSLDKNGCLWVKESKLNSKWIKEACQVVDFELERDRIGVLNRHGELFVKEGATNAKWVLEYRHTSAFDLEGDRIGIIDTRGRSYVKEGALNAAWTLIGSGVIDLQLEGNRIGTLRSDGTLYVKGPKVSSPWVRELKGVKAFALAGNRIVVSTKWGTLDAKEGPLNAAWVVLSKGGATSFIAIGDRIAMENNGRLWVKEGRLQKAWKLVATNSVTHYDITSRRVLIAISQTNNNVIQIKEPNVDSGWMALMGSRAIAVDVEGDYIGFITPSGVFYAKAPNTNDPWVRMAGASVAIQFEVW